MRLAFAAALLLLAGCGRAPAPANNQAEAAPPPAPEAAQPTGDVSGAERLVRARLGNPANITFANPRRTAGGGVPIVCGEFEQDGRRQRYIVVNGAEAFVEPQMRPGEMERAMREFCGVGERG